MHCKKYDCRYKSVLSGNISICYYCGITGTPRGCHPSECDKYEKQVGSRKKGNHVEILISHDKEIIEETRRRRDERLLSDVSGYI